MNRPPRVPLRLTAAAAVSLALALAAPGTARAQLPDEVVDDTAAASAANAERFGFEIPAAQLDSWIFGSAARVTRPGEPPRGPRERMFDQLELKIAEVARQFTLTPAQTEKLRLAGRGDILRFLARVEEKRREFEEVRKDQNKFGQFYSTLQPLRSAYSQGLFSEDSLFAKSIRRTLEPEQAEAFDKARRDRAAFAYASAVDLLSSRLGRALGLTREKREKLTRLILDETKPPRSLGTQEFTVVLFLASTVPEAKYREFLDDAQMGVLRRQFQRMRMMEQALKMNGFVPDDAPPLGD